MKILVVSVRPYSLIDKESGEVREGFTVRYLPQDSNFENGSLEIGKASFKPNDLILKKFSKLPATCNAVFTLKADKEGKVSLVLNDFVDVKPFDLKF